MRPSLLMRSWRTFLGALTVLLLTATVTACSPVRFVSGYDEQIDRGLTQLYADTREFVDRMIALRGRPEGTYEPNADFYRSAIARVESFTFRAEANQAMASCPSTALIGRALAAAGLPDEVRQQVGAVPEGECQVVLFRLMRGAFEDMRRLHQAQGARGIPESARGPLLEGGVGSLMRGAMAVEIAKRGGQ